MPLFYRRAAEWKMSAKTDRRVKREEIIMINFEEELKNFEPIHEVGEVEDAIYKKDLTDLADIMQEMMNESKINRNHLR